MLDTAFIHSASLTVFNNLAYIIMTEIILTYRYCFKYRHNFKSKISEFKNALSPCWLLRNRSTHLSFLLEGALFSCWIWCSFYLSFGYVCRKLFKKDIIVKIYIYQIYIKECSSDLTFFWLLVNYYTIIVQAYATARPNHASIIQLIYFKSAYLAHVSYI